MKKNIIITLGVVGMLAATPWVTLAEETGVSADGSAGASGSVTTPPPTPPVTVDSWSFGASNPSMPPPGKGGMGAGRMASGTGNGGPLMQHEVKSPRDAQSGQASGKRLNGLPPGTPVTGTMMRMNASGTRPLPPKMEDRMEKRDEMREQLKERASSTRENMEERRGEMRERMQERRGEILKRQAEHFVKLMNAAIERFEKIADRVDSRIAKLKEKGVDTTKAVANVAIARTKIGEAKTAIAAATASLDAAIANADASAGATTTVGTDAGKPVREALLKARAAVEAAHKALVDAIESLRANVKIEAHATTTATTTN